MHRIWVDGTEFRWTREHTATAGAQQCLLLGVKRTSR
jgi:hypothetical protein